MKPIDWTKPVQTVNGKLPVEVVTTQGRVPEFPVLVYIGSEEYTTPLTVGGRQRRDGDVTVENVPVYDTIHLNFYPRDHPEGDKYVVVQHLSAIEADLNRGPNCTYTLEVKVPRE